MVCLLAVAIDASRLTREPPKIKGALEVTSKNSSQPGEAAAVGGASDETARAPSLLNTPGPRSPQAMWPAALGSDPAENATVLLEGQGWVALQGALLREARGSVCEGWLPDPRGVILSTVLWGQPSSQVAFRINDS